jgi:hypothetical protein
MLKRNEGTADRIIRVMLGTVILLVAWQYLTGPWQIVAYVLAAAALLTGLVGVCGLYSLLGISTCPVKK